MKKKDKKKNNTELIATAISNLCIPCLRKYEEEIIGIYLSPYTVGGKQKIEVRIIHRNSEELEITKSSARINELQLFLITENFYKYQQNPRNEEEYKLSKDLKTGIIIYDPKKMLKTRKTSINQNEEITSFYNTIELPNSLRVATKNKVYSYNRVKKKN